MMDESHQIVSDYSFFYPLLLASLLTLAGCDALGEEQTVILSDTELSFQYHFEGSDLSSSATSELTSVNTMDVNLSAVLQDDGFALQDLRAITVENATLLMTFPVRQELDFLERIEIYLTTDQLSPVLVAESSQIRDGRRQISVPANSTRDIEAYVRAPVKSRLQLETDQELSEGEYEMDVTLQLAIEVGGL